MPDLFDIAVCTIFAREVMEGAIIVTQYRTVIQRSTLPEGSEATMEQMLRTVTLSAAAAAFLAIFVVAIVAIPLAVLSNDFDGTFLSRCHDIRLDAVYSVMTQH
jgi:high-affinity iron transporter